ncbi:MAG: acyl-CoA dehydrogenase family protein [Comamonas sp.]
MDFQLTEDQRAFADMAQSLFADYCTDDKLREHDASGQPFMQDLWQQCVASGLNTILVPEAAGGLGLGTTELLAVLEQQGRFLAQVPLWQQQVAAAAVAKFGGDDPRVTAAVQSVLEGALIALSLENLVASRGPRCRSRMASCTDRSMQSLWLHRPVWLWWPLLLRTVLPKWYWLACKPLAFCVSMACARTTAQWPIFSSAPPP